MLDRWSCALAPRLKQRLRSRGGRYHNRNTWTWSRNNMKVNAFTVRSLLFLISMAGVINFAYSFYTYYPDLPFVVKVQNIFTILMCFSFSILLFIIRNKEIQSILSEYYSSFRFVRKNTKCNCTFLFCCIFLSYAHYWLSSLTFILLSHFLLKIESISSRLSVDMAIYTSFTSNLLFFIVFSIPVISTMLNVSDKTNGLKAKEE